MQSMDCSYDPADNKIRLRSVSRLDPDIYARVKAAGFIWAPKQDLFVAPAWTPAREDLMLELCGEIGDEDTSLVDRAEQRAERFEEYRESRTEDAQRAHDAVTAITDIRADSPILVGHHSERHARKDAERIENGMRRAIKMWDTAQYWKDRAAGALRHAKYKELPGVRHRRIKTLAADLRKQQRAKADAEMWLKLWSIPDLPLEKALAIANRCWLHLPRKEGDREDFNQCPTAYDALTNGHPNLYAPRSLEEIVAVAKATYPRTIAYCDRWIAHLENRIAYEGAMLDEGGGLAGEKFDLQVGGQVLVGREWVTVIRVNKSEGHPVSVTTNARYGRVKGIELIKDYRPPTEGAAEKVKAATKRAPLCNFPGEGFRHKTRAELESRYHYIQEIAASETHGAYRTQCTYKGGSGLDCHNSVPVFITDAKIKEPPKLNGNAPKPELHELPKEQVGTRPVYRQPEPTAESAQFDSLRETLKAGVQVVSAPQLFPTPPEIARQMCELVGPLCGHRVLEPSAGTGNLIRAIFDNATGADCVQVVAVEINRALASALKTQRLKTLYANDDNFTIHCGDFLEQTPEKLGLFSRVILNPPFAPNAMDVKHIRHALTFLKPSGRLVALCANGPRQREQLMPEASEWIDLPAGSFKEAGTNVNVALAVFDAK